ncbi:MAG TPA: helix-turn-helix transcriptional regulator [Bacteroidales bacterium]|nr:helix-turn-helix transcriptional regulator [Bacteroidales bacterium]
MIERILEIMKSKQMSPSQFADELGIQRSGMSHLISGRNKPSLEFVLKVLNRFPDITADYLLFGKTSEPAGQKSSAAIQALAPAPNAQPTLFEPAAETIIEEKTDIEEKTEPASKPPRKSVRQKKAERIVFFYDDGSFKEFEAE